jgi:hypothetical protein
MSHIQPNPEHHVESEIRVELSPSGGLWQSINHGQISYLGSVLQSQVTGSPESISVLTPLSETLAHLTPDQS